MDSTGTRSHQSLLTFPQRLLPPRETLILPKPVMKPANIEREGGKVDRRHQTDHTWLGGRTWPLRLRSDLGPAEPYGEVARILLITVQTSLS